MNHEPDTSPDPEIVRFGLSRAIQIHSEEFRASLPHIQLDLDLVEDENLLPQETFLALYRCYTERLHQIAQNAQARQIWVHYYPTLTHMNLDVKDNGAGEPGPSVIARLRECVETAGGQLVVNTQPGEGTRVTAKVPFPR